MPMKRRLFKAGSRHCVKRNFMSRASAFIANELLIFTSDGYSHYDNCFVYEFHSQTAGQNKIWWLHHNEPAESWQELFEPLVF
jgi:hypothetical protein